DQRSAVEHAEEAVDDVGGVPEQAGVGGAEDRVDDAEDPGGRRANGAAVAADQAVDAGGARGEAERTEEAAEQAVAAAAEAAQEALEGEHVDAADPDDAGVTGRGRGRGVGAHAGDVDVLDAE